MKRTNSFVFGVKPPTEQMIKGFVLDHLRAENPEWARSVVASEFCLGETGVRVDLAVLGAEFLGIEIKSELDSLKRLPMQIAAYKSYFDRVVLVVAACHVRHLDWAALREVDVWQVSASGRVEVLATRTKLPTAKCFSDLLTLEEARRVAADATPEDYQAAFFDTFSRRHGCTSHSFWRLVEKREISADDLLELSRFRKERDRAVAWARQQQQDWSSWSASLAEVAGQLA